MKKSISIFMVCAAVMLVSCGKKATDLENSIPKNALMVMRFDVKKLLSKADCNLFENQTVKSVVEMQKRELSDSQKKVFDSFIKNPNSFGVDVIGDVYYFMNEHCMGVLMSVNNAKKLHDNLIAIDKSFEEMMQKDNGIYSIKIEDANVMWDNSKILLMMPYYGNVWAEHENIDFAHYFNLPKEESVVSDVNYQKFAATKGDITIYYAFSNYVNFMENFANRDLIDKNNTEVQNLMNKVFAIYESFKGVSTVMSCDFENGKIIAKSQMFYETKEDEQRYAEIYNFADAKLSGEFLKYVSQNPHLLMTMDFDGEKIINMIDKFGFTEYLDTIRIKKDIDVKTLINSIKGDFILSVNNVNLGNSTMPVSISVFAKLCNADAFKTEFDKLLKDSKDIDFLNFGVKNDVFYLFSNDNAKQLFETGAENVLMKKINGQPMFFYGDLSNLKESLQPLYAYQAFAPLIDKGLSLVETFESKYIDKDNGEFIINFTDKKQNSLKQIFVFINEALNKVPL